MLLSEIPGSRPPAAPRNDAALLQRARKRAAVEQDVLAGDETGLCSAQERAGVAELFRAANPPGRIEFCALGQHFVDGAAALLRLHLDDRTAQPVGVERAGQQSVDGDI